MNIDNGIRQIVRTVWNTLTYPKWAREVDEAARQRPVRASARAPATKEHDWLVPWHIACLPDGGTLAAGWLYTGLFDNSAYTLWSTRTWKVHAVFNDDFVAIAAESPPGAVSSPTVPAATPSGSPISTERFNAIATDAPLRIRNFVRTTRSAMPSSRRTGR